MANSAFSVIAEMRAGMAAMVGSSSALDVSSARAERSEEDVRDEGSSSKVAAGSVSGNAGISGFSGRVRSRCQVSRSVRILGCLVASCR